MELRLVVLYHNRTVSELVVKKGNILLFLVR
jgi:hypothetical protein